MNSLLLQRWLAFPFWLRAAMLVLSLAAGALILRQVWLRPLQQHADRLALQQQQEKKRHRMLLRHLRQRRSPQEIESEIVSLRQTLRPEAQQPFSLPQLADAAGGHLQAWQPTPGGGEITLKLNWPQLQALFHYLSEQQPSIVLPQFTLQRLDDKLRLKLVVRYER